MQKNVAIAVVEGNVFRHPADLLILKYAQGLHGVDAAVYKHLIEKGVAVTLPPENATVVADSAGTVAARAVLFVGVKPLYHFEYSDIRAFAGKAIAEAAEITPKPETVALTLHGAGFGLDEIEAFDAEVAGIVDGLMSTAATTSLKSVTIVEINPVRADLLDARLNQILPGRQVRLGTSRSAKTPARPTQAIRSAGTDSAKKPRLFVAMPFRKDMEDHFEYGILRPSKKCGFVCERADREVFTDDIVQWVKDRITSADLIVADLTGSNPNVYLEVGYAWGQGRTTLLLAQNADELRFDVRNQKCLVYGTIKELEQHVLTTLKTLKRRSR